MRYRPDLFCICGGNIYYDRLTSVKRCSRCSKTINDRSLKEFFEE